ncbi:PREDICTED: interleukin-22 receptor subunit alpha-1 [Merops nubicus]|uniref:interleukin-22 receptor subunit alpha-1 n=1 Tax=Merops nubicus TaxID=57421 RepID=UPI0004F00055|nr:PREDICTED: interleukin-22 receptor subunit alpha-1 [Merops nubicus]
MPLLKLYSLEVGNQVFDFKLGSRLLEIFRYLSHSRGIVTTERSSCLKRAAFSSTNFENILTWETEANIPPGTVFDVQYKQYGEKSWLNKRECQSITQPFCNLSRETENVSEHYYARVRATGHSCSSSWLPSERFEPRKETIIGAPEVEYIPYVRSIKFLIHPPYTPLRGEDDRQLTIEDIYSKFGAVDYQLTIFNQRTHQKWTKNENNKEFEVSNLDPDTEYNGTVSISLLQKSSKAQVFWVKTLADNTWLLYCFVPLAFCAGLVFAAVSYGIYKYVKQHGAQPMSLDFRGISPFQPLTLTVEHIIKPISLPKPPLLIPEVQLPQISHHLDRALEPLRSFHLPDTAYQQQAEVPALQLPMQPACLAGPAPTCYAPQAGKQSLPTATSSKSLPLTYGVCGEGTDRADKKNLQPTQMLKDVSPDSFVGGMLITQMLDKSCSHWNYKEQKPNLALWNSSDTTESVLSQGGPGQTQQLLLQPDGMESKEHVPQLSLSLLEQGGCYRQQTAQPPQLLSSVKVNTDYIREDEPLSSLPAAFLLSVSPGHSFSGESNTKQWMLPDSFSHSANKLQFPETPESETLMATKEPGCTELNNASPDTISDWDHGTPLTMFFKDLNLKVLWDQDENTEFY